MGSVGGLCEGNKDQRLLRNVWHEQTPARSKERHVIVIKLMSSLSMPSLSAQRLDFSETYMTSVMRQRMRAQDTR